MTLRMMDAPSLSDEMALALGEIGLKIETVFGFPQDIEWAYQQGELFILQSRQYQNPEDLGIGRVIRSVPGWKTSTGKWPNKACREVRRESHGGEDPTA